MYEKCKETTRKLLQYCKKFYMNGEALIEYIEFKPILNVTSYKRTVEKKKKNYRDFINKIFPEIKSTPEFLDLVYFLSKRSEFQTYYSGKLLATDGTIIKHPNSKDIEPWLSEFVKSILINYLEENNSFNFNSKNFSKIYHSLKIHLQNFDKKYYFVALYNFKGNFPSANLKKNLAIGKCSQEEFSKIANMNTLEGRRKIPPFHMWKVRYVLRGRFLDDNGSANLKAEKEFLKILEAFRLFQEGNIQLGSIFQYSTGKWDLEHQISQKIILPLTDESLYYTLSNDKISIFKKFLKNYAKQNFEGKTLSFIGIAVRRFNSAIESEYFEDKVTNCVICLESLLLEDEGELKFRLATRLAYLLANNDREREFLWKFTTECYKLRSRIVHGKPRKKFQIDGKEFTNSQIIKKLADIVRKTIQAILILIKKYKNQIKLLQKLDEGIVNSYKMKTLQSSIYK